VPTDLRPGYTVSEVARALRIGRRRVRELVRSGSLPAIDVGRDLSRRPRVIVLAADLEKWIQGRRVGPPPPQPRRRRRASGQVDYYPD
jgi:excisionase family DNA binding protein